MTVQVEDIVTMESWSGDWVDVVIQRLGDSKVYGKTIEGIEVETGRFTALPISHLIELGRVRNTASRRWDLTLPDGDVLHLKSKRAAKEMCEERGLVFSEE